MNAQELRDARRSKGWTQVETARRLGVTQAYLSMLERGRRTMPYSLARRVVELLQAPPTALPLRQTGLDEPAGSDKLRAELAALEYPRFMHVLHQARPRKARRNPAEVLLSALNESNLDSRVSEGLPWLVARYPDMDWDWLVSNAKVRDRQNRLGFVASLGLQLAQHAGTPSATRRLGEYVDVLDHSRLAREDTLCQDALTQAERVWLRENRPNEAKHWNLLTDMRVENLTHAGL